MNLSHLTNIKLIARVRAGGFNADEQEMAERLSEAINEIEILVDELKRLTAEAITNGDDTGG